MNIIRNENLFHPNLIKNKFNLIDCLCGTFLFIPFFLMISGTSVSLPQDYYNPTGFPLHVGMLFFFFYLSEVKIEMSKMVMLLILLLYALIWALDPTRQLLIIQSSLFIFYFIFFESIPEQRLMNLVKYGLNAIKIFAIAHVISVIAMPGVGDVGFVGSITEFYGFPIYQAGVTYPAILIFALIIDKEIFSTENNISYWVFLLAVIFIELSLARRVSIGFMALYLLFYHFRLSMIGSGFIGIGAAIYNIDITLLYRLVDRFNEILTLNLRQYPIIRSINMLQDPAIFLYGNGRPNWAHNYPLQLATTHGVFYTLIILTIFFYYCVHKYFHENLKFKKWSLVILGFMTIDFMVNANLTQPIYAGVLTITIVSVKKFGLHNQSSINKHAESR